MDQQNPYRGQDATELAATHEDELAGRGTRLGAAIIDTIILLAILMPLMYMGGYWTQVMTAAQAGESIAIGTALTWAAIGFVVFAVVQGVPLNATGQTWGKRLLKIKIVDLDGAKPPIGRLLGLRYLPLQVASNVPMVGPLLALVNVLLIFRGDRRCGHDLIAGTKVVHAE